MSATFVIYYWPEHVTTSFFFLEGRAGGVIIVIAQFPAKVSFVFVVHWRHLIYSQQHRTSRFLSKVIRIISGQKFGSMCFLLPRETINKQLYSKRLWPPQSRGEGKRKRRGHTTRYISRKIQKATLETKININQCEEMCGGFSDQLMSVI